MRRKTYVILLSLSSLILIFIACREESIFSGKKSAPVPLSVERSIAKSWYEENAGNRRSIRTRSSKHDITLSTLDMEPVWEESFSRKNGRYKTVEALMLGAKRKSFTSEISYRKYQETSNPRYNRSLTRLIILTDLETNETIGFTMTIMPSVEYMEYTKFKPFYNSYLKRDEKFDGYIIYHDLDGNFANGWKYREGKITHLVTKDITPSKAITRNGESGHEECEEYVSRVLVETCNEYCTVNEYGEDYCETTSCTYEWEERDRWTECVWIEDEDNEGGSSGGSSGGYIPPVQTTLDQIYDIENSTLSVAQKDRLKKAFSDLSKYPQMRKILSYLESKSYKIKFVIDPEHTASFSSHQITFANINLIGEKPLMHELIHAYQDVFYGKDAMKYNIFNIELETYLMVDIIGAMYLNHLYSGESTAIGGSCSENLEKNITDFINSIIDKGYINESDLGTYSLIGEEWYKVSGNFNDNFQPEMLMDFFNFKIE